MNDERKPSFENELLDRALEHRRAEEPRPGLEERVLARLETAGQARRGWFFKLGAVAVPAALLIVAAVYTLRSPEMPEPPRIVQAAPPVVADPVQPEVEVSAPVPPIATPPIAKRHEPEVARRVESAASRSPMFPSPRALSPQEALLVRFVRSARPETLQAVSESPPGGPLQIEELSTQPLHVEPLPAADPLSAS